jgi:hypothetical protein
VLHRGADAVVGHHDQDVVGVEVSVQRADPRVDVAVHVEEQPLAVVLPSLTGLGEVRVREDVERLDPHREQIDLALAQNLRGAVELGRDRLHVVHVDRIARARRAREPRALAASSSRRVRPSASWRRCAVRAGDLAVAARAHTAVREQAGWRRCARPRRPPRTDPASRAAPTRAPRTDCGPPIRARELDAEAVERARDRRAVRAARATRAPRAPRR